MILSRGSLCKALFASALALSACGPLSDPEPSEPRTSAVGATNPLLPRAPRGPTTFVIPPSRRAPLLPPGALPDRPITVVSGPGLADRAEGTTTVQSELRATPGVAACTTHNTVNHGGPVMSNPVVHRVFMGPWNAAAANGFDSTWSQIANTPGFYNRLKEYGVGTGSAGVRINHTGDVKKGFNAESVITNALTAELKTRTNAGKPPTANDMWVVFLPTGYNTIWCATVASPGPPIKYNAEGACWAHHASYTASINGTSYNVRYAIIDPRATDDMNEMVEHETAEAFTDPDWLTNNGAWYESGQSAGNGEVGDNCESPSTVLTKIAGVTMEAVWSQQACRCVGMRNLNGFDYEGDGATNVSVFRSSNAVWYINGGTFWHFGQAGDFPYGGDYDGDGRSELSLFRDGAAATVFILTSKASSFSSYAFGTTGDKPVPGDYDGDGRTDIAVWRPSNGTWYVRQSSNAVTISSQWGVSTDIPVPGDYDGDQKTDFAIFRPSTGQWWMLLSTGGSWVINSSMVAGDIPVQSDYDGDGRTDWAFWHPADGTFHWTYNGGTGGSFYIYWGIPGDVPVPADYDGDWLTDFAVWRPSNGTWYAMYSSTWTSGAFGWGQAGDLPIQEAVIR